MSTSFDWSSEKNRRLIATRGVSFERVLSAFESGGMVGVRSHPNQERYPGQQVYLVEIDQYIHMVPFVVADDGTHFLKTIIPSRKATRQYRKERSS